MRSTARLAILVLAIALTISRLGLVFHELVGHGGVAVALGGDVVAWSLHAFGGGWLDYDRPRGGGMFAEYAVDTGGIAVEWLLAIVCAIVARRGSSRTLELAFEGAAWAFAIHAGWYLSAGTFHGFGDGWLLHQRLGDARLAIALPVGAAIVIAGYFAGARIATRLRGFAPGRGTVALALALGLGAHGALAGAEHALRSDPTYTVTMRTATERAIEATLAQEVTTAQAQGQTFDVAAARADLERQHRDFPFRILLIVAIGLAAALGVVRSRAPASSQPVRPRTVAIAVTAAVLAIALVVILDRLSP